MDEKSEKREMIAKSRDADQEAEIESAVGVVRDVETAGVQTSLSTLIVRTKIGKDDAHAPQKTEMAAMRKHQR